MRRSEWTPYRPTKDISDETAGISLTVCFRTYDVTSYQHQRTPPTVIVNKAAKLFRAQM